MAKLENEIKQSKLENYIRKLHENCEKVENEIKQLNSEIYCLSRNIKSEKSILLKNKIYSREIKTKELEDKYEHLGQKKVTYIKFIFSLPPPKRNFNDVWCKKDPNEDVSP